MIWKKLKKVYKEKKKKFEMKLFCSISENNKIKDLKFRNWIGNGNEKNEK